MTLVRLPRSPVRLEPAWAMPLVAWAASRALFFTVGEIAAHTLHHVSPGTDVLSPGGALAAWARWDGAWYSGIAVHGYGDFHAPASASFFPLLPLLVRVGTWIGGGPAIWGVLVSTAAALAALAFTYRLGEHVVGPRTARLATLALAFFPASFFLNAVYTEALFLAFTTGSLWAALVRRDLLLAGVLAALGSATRREGILLVLPLAVELYRRAHDLRVRDLVGVFLVPAGLLAYMGYLWAAFGDPILFAKTQHDYWSRGLTAPWTTIARGWNAGARGAYWLFHPDAAMQAHGNVTAFALADAIGLLAFALLVALVVGAWRVLPFGLWIYTAAVAATPVLFASQTMALTGLSRYMMAAVPLYFVLGRWLERGRLRAPLWLAASAVAGAYLAAFFTTWRWVA